MIATLLITWSWSQMVLSAMCKWLPTASNVEKHKAVGGSVISSTRLNFLKQNNVAGLDHVELLHLRNYLPGHIRISYSFHFIKQSWKLLMLFDEMSYYYYCLHIHKIMHLHTGYTYTFKSHTHAKMNHISSTEVLCHSWFVWYEDECKSCWLSNTWFEQWRLKPETHCPIPDKCWHFIFIKCMQTLNLLGVLVQCRKCKTSTCNAYFHPCV